jgi:histidine phosphotransferase ChpT
LNLKGCFDLFTIYLKLRVRCSAQVSRDKRMHDQTSLSSLIGSRICHDLISPVGAVANGLELLSLAGDHGTGPELALIGDSISNAGAKIRFFRIAYGLAGDEEVAEQDVTRILTELNKGARVQMQWTAPGPIRRAELRLAFLALQCGETALAFGGKAQMSRIGETWQMRAEGQRLRWEPDLWEELERGARASGITPATVQFALLPILAAEEGRKLRVTHHATAVTLEF